jgi:hypothetical protein
MGNFILTLLYLVEIIFFIYLTKLIISICITAIKRLKLLNNININLESQELTKFARRWRLFQNICFFFIFCGLLFVSVIIIFNWIIMYYLITQNPHLFASVQLPSNKGGYVFAIIWIIIFGVGISDRIASNYAGKAGIAWPRINEKNWWRF